MMCEVQTFRFIGFFVLTAFFFGFTATARCVKSSAFPSALVEVVRTHRTHYGSGKRFDDLAERPSLIVHLGIIPESFYAAGD